MVIAVCFIVSVIDRRPGKRIKVEPQDIKKITFFRLSYTGFEGGPKGVSLKSIIFQDRPMFSHISQKVSARAFH